MHGTICGDELHQLIEEHRAAAVALDAADEADQEAALKREYDAEGALLAYRPGDLDEVRAKARYLAGTEVFVDDERGQALIASLAA